MSPGLKSLELANESDQQLIKNLLKGDAHAFEKVFHRYNEKVYAFSLKYLKNKRDAEGIVQEVFLSLWDKKSKLQDIKDLNAWIFAISYNIIKRRFCQLASERKHLQKFADIALTEDDSTNTQIEYNDLIKKAKEIIEKLPSRQKAVFNLSKIEGFSNAEISERLKISKKTVENHLTKAKAFVRQALVDNQLISILFFLLFFK